MNDANKMIINYHWVSARSMVISFFRVFFNLQHFCHEKVLHLQDTIRTLRNQGIHAFELNRYQMDQIFVLSLHYLAANAWDNLEKEDEQHQ